VDRRAFLGTVAGGLLAAPLAAEGQQAGKVWRVGSLSTGVSTGSSTRRLLSEGLQALGYVEGSFILELRYAEARVDRLPALAAELVQLNVDVIVAWGGEPLAACAKPRAEFQS
jgi:putative ABC transport system substrate-binding protein